MKIKPLLTQYFWDQYELDSGADYEIERLNANELITKDRIDLIVKLKYIEYKEKGYNLDFVKELYAAHIEAFSLGTFTEPGNEIKNSIEKYFNDFDDLIANIKNNGFDETISVIPVGSNNAIIDGSHRVAVAAYFNLEIPIVRFNHICVTYDAQHFTKNFLNETYIDYLVNEYCRIKENIYFACVWPKAKVSLQREKMHLLLNESCEIVYKKKIKLNYKGLRNLIIQAYSDQDWLGSIENDFSGAHSKVDACYDSCEIVTAYVLECKNYEKVLELKRQVRDIFQIGKNSIHITDKKMRLFN